MLKIDRLNFSQAGKTVLHNISADFASCRIHGIIGPNGAGKTTLLKIMCRIWEHEKGRVYLDNRDCRTIPRKELSRLITLVPQNTSILFPISVYDAVSMGRYPHQGRFQSLGQKDREIIDNALKTCGIDALKNRAVTELSGGESQLAAIARALVTEARYILMDEPTSELDIHHVLTIMDILDSLKRIGKTLVIAIHDLNLARRFCDTVSILHKGEIYYTGTPKQVFFPGNIQKVFGVNVTEVKNGSISLLYFSNPGKLS